MTARIITPVILAVLATLGFLWFEPLGLVLGARGYSAQDITAMKAATEPQPDVPCLQASPAQNVPQGNNTETRLPRAEQAPETELPATAPEPENPSPPPARKIIATATVNMRAGQGTDTAVVGQIKPQEVVTVVADPEGDWLKVQAASATGWVYRPLFDKR